MYKLFLTFRYLRKRRIAYFAIAAVILCTAMVLIVTSVMGGFLDQLKRKARGLLGDVIIDNRWHNGFPLYDEFIADISSWPEIAKATPVLYTYGLLRFPETGQTNTVRVVGLRLQDVYEVNAFKRSLYYETYYPGTTTLEPQQQPLLGFDLGRDPVALRAGDGEFVPAPQPVLPPEYMQALRRSWAAGARDDQSPLTAAQQITRAAGQPEIVGIYDLVEGFGPPRMAGEPYPGLIIGRDIVAQRQADGSYERWLYPRGCAVTLTIIPSTEDFDAPLKLALRYVDDSRTGIYEIDSQHAYCDFAQLQRHLRMDAGVRVDAEGREIGTFPARCHQIQIKLTPGTDAQAAARRLEQHYQSFIDDPRFRSRLTASEAHDLARVQAFTWEQSQAHIIAPVEKERQLVTILFGIISLVAAVLVLCILYMIVLQKTRDIGIVKAIGGSPLGVAAIFIAYGAAIGIVGSAIGTVLGYYFVTYINEIQDFLTRLNPAWQVWDRAVYSFDEIPNTVRPADMLTVLVAAVVAATFGSLVAALRAGFMQPVEALRHE